jgi:hypothetical protein
MGKISKKEFRAAYDVAKRIREGKLSGQQGITLLENQYGFNRNSAETYIHDYDCMVKGQRITRKLNAPATEYYLTRFLEDGGQDALSRALSALRQHIEYYENKTSTRLNLIRNIYNHFHSLNNQAIEFEAKVRQGAGFGDPKTNKKVETAAIKHVRDSYVSQGWAVRSVEAEKCGYDLHCTKGHNEEHVEVKGVQGKVVSFIITRGEKRRAKEDSNFVLYVVTSALTDKRTLWSYRPREILKLFRFEALAYQASLIG